MTIEISVLDLVSATTAQVRKAPELKQYENVLASPEAIVITPSMIGAVAELASNLSTMGIPKADQQQLMTLVSGNVIAALSKLPPIQMDPPPLRPKREKSLKPVIPDPKPQPDRLPVEARPCATVTVQVKGASTLVTCPHCGKSFMSK